MISSEGPIPINVEPLTIGAAFDVSSIERDCYPKPLTRLQVKQLLKSHKEFCGVVAYSSGFSVGYILYSCYTNAIKVHRIGVNKLCRRRGVGSAMVDAIKGPWEMSVEIPDGNLEGQKFFKSQNFVAKNIKSKGSEGDHIVFTWVPPNDKAAKNRIGKYFEEEVG